MMIAPFPGAAVRASYPEPIGLGGIQTIERPDASLGRHDDCLGRIFGPMTNARVQAEEGELKVKQGERRPSVLAGAGAAGLRFHSVLAVRMPVAFPRFRHAGLHPTTGTLARRAPEPVRCVTVQADGRPARRRAAISSLSPEMSAPR